MTEEKKKKDGSKKRSWLITLIKVLGTLVLIVLVIFIAFITYVLVNKKKILNQANVELGKHIDGTFSIGDVQPSFHNFPSFSLSLQDILLKDKNWPKHHHTLLYAKYLYIAINPLSLVNGRIEISRIGIRQAQIDLFTDSLGYANTSVFKKNPQSQGETGNKKSKSSFIEVKNIELHDVNFSLENERRHKHFQFDAIRLEAMIKDTDSGWRAHAYLNTHSQLLAFNTKKGSFIQNQAISGLLDLNYNEKKKRYLFAPNALHIGTENFVVGAILDNSDTTLRYTFNISNAEILWKNASSLLARNISRHLDHFILNKPIAVQAILKGSFNGGTDPLVYVTCQVRGNKLSTPEVEGELAELSFNGLFTNQEKKNLPLDDKNSVIKLQQLKTSFKGLPFSSDSIIIANLEKPIMSGVLKSQFPIEKLNPIIGPQNMKFSKGKAAVQLSFKGDLVNYEVSKPQIVGDVKIKDADILYTPRNIPFQKTSLSLKLTPTDLLLNDIRIQNGKSVLFMDGRVSNFLNFYYDSPEKIILNWNIRSPQIYLGEFLGFLNSKKKPVKKLKKTKDTHFSDRLSLALEKGKASMHLRVDKVYYKKFLATDTRADLLLSEEGIAIQGVQAKTSGGSLKLNGQLIQDDGGNHFHIHSDIDNVNISSFFYSFDNFGMENLTYKNIQGTLSTNATINGDISDRGTLIPKSLSGNLTMDLKNAALINYHTIVSFGKFIFPFRDLKNIRIERLQGKFDIEKERVTIYPLQINSSVLNVNISGVYSFGRGTNILFDVPLRNPKKDLAKSDSVKKANRFKGIVLHVQARDDESGKLSFHLVKDPKKLKRDAVRADSAETKKRR